MSHLILSPEVEGEIAKAYNWYEEQSLGLGDEFILCIDAAFSSIARDPQIYQVVYKNIRRTVLRRFPYCIFFVIEDSHIQVLAVFHAHRNPTEWEKRKV